MDRDKPVCNGCKRETMHHPPPQTPPLPPLPRPPFSTPAPLPYYKQKSVVITGATIMGSMLTTALLVGIFCALVRFYLNRRNRSRRRNLPLFLGAQEDFVDEGRGPGPHLDNPIWYINTVGLQQSVIDSITDFKYKKDEGLMEGTDCSVCLNEFQEDETLRLLPKCSHAFHLPCIDTWLRSHKNCPLCRAPVVCEAAMVAQPSDSSQPNSTDISGSRNESMVENSENYGRNEGGEGGSTTELTTCPTEAGNTSENSKKSLVQSKTRISDSDSQILSSDLSDDDVQPMRRSVSLDLSSALVIYSDVAHKHQGSLDSSELQQIKNLNGKIVGKRGSESSSICSRLMRSSSIGRTLSKGPIAMKRSLSSGGKFLLSKQSRSQDSILPL